MSLLVTFGLSSTAIGQTGSETGALKRMTLEQLSQIEITSVNKEPAPAFRTPAAITIITSEQIHDSSARNIPDLLRLIPGVNVAQVDSSNWAIGIRGFEGKLSRSVLVLIDGRSVYTPLFAGVYWEMQDVLLDDIERIEVIRGPAGTIWGSNAVNGVINIITKNARSTRGALVSARGGSVDQGAVGLRFGGGDDRLSYRIYGKGFTEGPQQHPNNLNFDDWRRAQMGFRVDSRLGVRDELTIQGDTYAGEGGQSLQISSYTPPAVATVMGEKTFSGSNLMAAWRHGLSSGGDLQVRAYYDRTDRKELNFREIRNTFDVDFIHHAPVRRHDITWGLGVRSSPSHFFQTAPTIDFQPARQTYNIFSAFFQDDITLVPKRLNLTLGSKFENTSFSGFNVQPSARISWAPTEKQTFWGAVTRAVRTPSRIEQDFQANFLTQPSAPLFVRLVGDGGFTPENMVGYEAGYRHFLSKLGFVSLSLFRNHYTDLESVESGSAFVESVPQAPPRVVLPLFLRNGIAATSTGGELAAVWDLTPWWRLRGSYSLVLMNARRQAGGTDTSTIRQLEGDTPEHKGVLQSSFQLPRRLYLQLDYRYVSAAPDQGVRAYSTGDARFGWRPRRPVEFELVGRNLFQPCHVEYGGDPGVLIGIKRSVSAGITWRR